MLAMSEPEKFQEARERRQETSDRLVDSEAPKKLVVAGPGTGKTHNFRRALERAGGGLALTFIRALAQDLEEDLGDLAQVNTFHGFCKHLAHKFGGVPGLTGDFDYYPELLTLIADDIAAVHGREVDRNSLERAIRVMDDGERLVSQALSIADYYDATSHNDVVYRVQKYLEENPNQIPEYPVIVVDEYQDFNLLETRFIETLGERNQILIAGDDDQALYGFKDASADFIRELAQRGDMARFDLPYCSRCTEVIVEAVNVLVREAQERGHLERRIEREYLCFLPDKQGHSEANPALIHAACSVNNKNAPYISRYVAKQIGEIPLEDIEASRSGGHPTALVIGRLHWVKQVYEYLRERFTNVGLQQSAEAKIEPLDAYKRLATNRASRLGWRILLHTTPCEGAAGIVKAALTEDRELFDLLPQEYRDYHLSLAAIVKKLLDEGQLDPDEESLLENGLQMNIEEIRERLQLGLAEEEQAESSEELSRAGEDAGDEPSSPEILCTSLVGAKGLSAEHVFIVGCVNGVFPADPADITNSEICELIVGLSRTRKACHLISSGMWGGEWFKPSAFFHWLSEVPIEYLKVDKSYWS